MAALTQHVASAPAAAAARPYAELGAPADQPLKLLSDAQMHEFLGQGFLTLGLDDLGSDFHEYLYERARAEFGPEEENSGLRGTGGSTERIPELLTMVNSPTVAGALVSLLGHEYAHGHLGVSGCALHVSTTEDQIFHKDTQRAIIVGHRTRALMVMYYPGAADVDMGPTAIVPSSHLLARDGLGLSLGVQEDGEAGERDRDDWGGLGAGQAEILPAIAPTLFEHKVVVPPSQAGSICIVHEDMVHRATERLSEDAKWRPMFKFSFTRLHEPAEPSWAHDPSAPDPAVDSWPALAAAEAGAACGSLWRWHKGERAPAVEPDLDVAALGATVLAPACAGDEAARVGAAYALGSCGNAAALAVLAEGLCSEGSESARRAGAHGLGSAGDAAVPTLIRVLNTPARTHAILTTTCFPGLSLIDCLWFQGISALVAGGAVDALGDAAMSPDRSVIYALDAACWEQHAAIAATEATPETTEDELPLFDAGGMISHVNDSLQVPIMLPVACRPLAARYLVIAMAQIALGRISQRWASEPSAADRAVILDALRPWGQDKCPRVRKENGRAVFLLCQALASSVTDPAAPSAGELAEVNEMREVVLAGELDGKKLPASDQCLAALGRVAAVV